MILLKETAGDTLVGGIDGANTEFTTTFDFTAETVNVYLNGRLKLRDWDDGFWVVGTRTVVMKEPPELGDTLEVEYRSDTKTGGGASGGVPQAATVQVLKPEAEGEGEHVPDVQAQELAPSSTSSEHKPGVSSRGELRPVIVRDDG
jgi:hypothetical protein